MRPSKCGQDQANQTLRSRARAKNEGIFGVFECDIVVYQAIDLALFDFFQFNLDTFYPQNNPFL